jgi:hypothetical protein
MLAPGYEWNMDSAMEEVSPRLIALLLGKPWKRDQSRVVSFRGRRSRKLESLRWNFGTIWHMAREFGIGESAGPPKQAPPADFVTRPLTQPDRVGWPAVTMPASAWREI